MLTGAAADMFKGATGHNDEAILKNYDNIPDALQAELPLKRIWGLVLEEE